MSSLSERDIMIQRADAFAVWATRKEPPELRFRLLPHIVYLASIVTEEIIKGRGRLIINMPPQHGKSWFLSRWLIIWALEHNPMMRVMMASYSDRLVRGHSRYVRNQFRRNPYLTTRLSEDSQAADIWNTHNGYGGMLATTIGGQASGFPFDLGLIDDPYKGWKEAWSGTVRKNVKDWFDAEFYARRQENSSIIVLHTRWHPNDLTGYLLNDHSDEWKLIRLPAIAQDDDPMGRAVGEALCPELHSVRSLMGSKGSQAIWDAVYQQDPKGFGDSRIYSKFSDVRNVDPDVELRSGLPLHLSMDFNVRPGMHAEIGQHWTADDTIVAVHELHEGGMDVRKCMIAFESWWNTNNGRKRFPEIHVFGDSSGNARTLTTSESCYDLVKQKLNQMGVAYRIRVPAQAPGVRNSIDDFNEALCDVNDQVHYLIHPRCEKLITDLKKVQPDKAGYPDKDVDPDLTHASDAERYRVTRIRRIQIGTSSTSRVNV